LQVAKYEPRIQPRQLYKAVSIA